MRIGMTLALMLVTLATALPIQAFATDVKALTFEPTVGIRILDAQKKQLYVLQSLRPNSLVTATDRFFPKVAKKISASLSAFTAKPLDRTINKSSIKSLQLNGFGMSGGSSGGGGGCDPNVASCN